MSEPESISVTAEPAPDGKVVRPMSGMATVAAVLIGTATVMAVASSWTAWRSYLVVRDYLDGVPGVLVADLDAADNASAVVAGLYLGALSLSGVALLGWLWRARSNSEAMTMAQHRRGRGWVVGGWFCPIVNFWVPPMIISDIWKTSRPAPEWTTYDLGRVPGTPLIGCWWASVLVAGFLDRYVAGIVLRDPTVGSLHTAAVVGTVGTVLTLGGAVLIIMIIRRITAWQEAARSRPPG
ncbi:DUF4328 domain-containing protein [Amycolatopsis cihanbeyliensis]|uniref:Uncharacterized protein DUF4328 n=1 Tax=Amycolatopsis cihanbeyliensis TaxID=1128664 RepID=A0A542DJI1_AMYCI|nr:DUF4328 domain-containing protein [Amycolatopsis cihanbeyliensis]TQJ03252.1 uncharacterized protein DUF4328 [Amycolatopsis cihanbeyliensis]